MYICYAKQIFTDCFWEGKRGKRSFTGAYLIFCRWTGKLSRELHEHCVCVWVCASIITFSMQRIQINCAKFSYDSMRSTASCPCEHDDAILWVYVEHVCVCAYVESVFDMMMSRVCGCI